MEGALEKYRPLVDVSQVKQLVTMLDKEMKVIDYKNKLRLEKKKMTADEVKRLRSKITKMVRVIKADLPASQLPNDSILATPSESKKSDTFSVHGDNDENEPELIDSATQQQ